MKSLKLMMIAAFLATAIVNQAASDGSQTTPNKKVIEINVLQAMSNPALYEATRTQVNHNMFVKDLQVYTAKVVFLNYIFYISGTYEQWTWFFSPRLENVGKKRTDSRAR